jgi:16S rRNA processing protein RimM
LADKSPGYSLCFTAAGEELGEVLEVVEDGGGHLLRLRRDSGELLVPFVEAFLHHLDIAAGRIELSLPPGLIDICTSAS